MRDGSRRQRGTNGRRRGASASIWFATSACLLALAVAIALATHFDDDPAAASGTAVDLKGQAVELEDPIDDASVLERMEVDDDTGERIRVPSVGLDVGLGSLNVIDHQITPPGFTSAYIVRNLGSPDDAEAGTTYVVMHSIPEPGLAPGNFVIDVDSGEPAVSIGAAVELGGSRYEIESAYTVSKDELASREDLWSNDPARLVIITCQQLPTGEPSVENTVIEARLVQQ